MCLNTINQVFSPPDPKIRRGWKVFRRDSAGSLVGDFYSIDPSYTPGEWNRSTDGLVARTFSEKTYEKGFHIFRNKADAQYWHRTLSWSDREVHPVEYYDTVVEGAEKILALEFPTDVAKYMRILPEGDTTNEPKQ